MMDSINKSKSREDKNTLFTVLSNHRRRYILYACNQSDGGITLSAVAEQVAAWEYDKPIEELTSAERKRIYTSIRQHHLEKLEEAGLIEVENDHLKITEKAKNLDLYFEIVPHQNIPWALYYLGLAIIGGFFLIIASLNWLPEPVTPSVIAGAFIILLGVSALIHVLEVKQMKFDSTAVPPEIEQTNWR